jgi:hypothetical protein
MKAGTCPAQAGEDQGLVTAILPEIVALVNSPVSAGGGALAGDRHAFPSRDLIPNGERMPTEDDLKRIYALLAEGKIDDEAAQAAAEAVEARQRRREGN